MKQMSYHLSHLDKFMIANTSDFATIYIFIINDINYLYWNQLHSVYFVTQAFRHLGRRVVAIGIHYLLVLISVRMNFYRSFLL